MDNQQKEEKIRNENIEYVYFEPFTEELMHLEPEEFVKNFLLNKFNLNTLVVGFNYSFGYKGKGNTETLKQLGKKYNFKVEVVEPMIKDDNIISSSYIRELLAEGRVKEAKEYLGDNYKVKGIIKEGKQLGHKVGIPTANLSIDNNKLLPKNGVYYTRVKIDDKFYDGLTNLGSNPTFKDHPYAIETYIYDFDENIYGKEVELEFIEFVRGEIKFNNLEELFSRVRSDIDYIDKKYRKNNSNI